LAISDQREWRGILQPGGLEAKHSPNGLYGGVKVHNAFVAQWGKRDAYLMMDGGLVNAFFIR